eukprot:Lithocolla_globosa_v1_NODE_618_length_3583_cov_3.898810.p1 type:complete len:474 gc:universal NODE_618_length_3583_cov_3.898810:245-1666(+)
MGPSVRATMVKSWSSSTVVWVVMEDVVPGHPRVYLAVVYAFGDNRSAVFADLLRRVESLISEGVPVIIMGDFNTPLRGLPGFSWHQSDEEPRAHLLGLEQRGMELMNRRNPTPTTRGLKTFDLVYVYGGVAGCFGAPDVIPVSKLWSTHSIVSITSDLSVPRRPHRYGGRVRSLRNKAEQDTPLSVLFREATPAGVLRFQGAVTESLANGPCYLPDTAAEWVYLSSVFRDCAIVTMEDNHSARMRKLMAFRRAELVSSGDIVPGDAEWLALHKQVRFWNRAVNRETRERERSTMPTDGMKPPDPRRGRPGLPADIVDEGCVIEDVDEESGELPKPEQWGGVTGEPSRRAVPREQQPSYVTEYFSMIGRLSGDHFDEGFYEELEVRDKELANVALLYDATDHGSSQGKDITLDELRHAIARLKRGKAAGLDGIPAEVFIHLPPEALFRVLGLFNTILAQAAVPPQWWEGGDSNP